VQRRVTTTVEETCEFAIVVSDEKQGQGIGSRLMTKLMAAAREHGLKAMEGFVSASNKPMLTLMHELSFSIEHLPEDPDIVLVERRL